MRTWQQNLIDLYRLMKYYAVSLIEDREYTVCSINVKTKSATHPTEFKRLDLVHLRSQYTHRLNQVISRHHSDNKSDFSTLLVNLEYKNKIIFLLVHSPTNFWIYHMHQLKLLFHLLNNFYCTNSDHVLILLHSSFKCLNCDLIIQLCLFRLVSAQNYYFLF